MTATKQSTVGLASHYLPPVVANKTITKAELRAILSQDLRGVSALNVALALDLIVRASHD